MRQALYRKYRSRGFDEVVGQEHVTKTLRSAIKSGKVSHAYLFTGPRGIGKTSVARILAHEVNQLPYKDESVHLDIIEIDAASNRRIDEVRDLRDKVRIAPTSAKFKVYIIDEVHMLTREAFNALLKTLEEPPAHVIFILATTEVHKLPETIISRTQRFEFKPITKSAAVDHLAQLAKHEKIDIDRQALELLAEFGKGSFRDSIGYLDQLSTQSGKITPAKVRSLLGLPSDTEIDRLLSAIEALDPKAALFSLGAVKDQGVDAAAAASALADAIRRKATSGRVRPNIIGLLKQLIEVPASARPYDYLEIAVLEACQSDEVNHPPAGRDDQATDSNSSQHTESKQPPPKIAPSTAAFELSHWADVIVASRTQAASIYTALRLAQPEIEEGELILKFKYPLHQKKIDQAKNKQLISAIIEEVTGQTVKLRCVVDKQAFSPMEDNSLAEPSLSPPPLSSINNIFGGAEVLES